MVGVQSARRVAISIAVGLTLAASAGLACTGSRPAAFGFYAYFAPVSFSASPHRDDPGFDSHRGFEADLLTAVEALGEGRFRRRAIPYWAEQPPPIWQRASSAEFDVVGGGITILESRTVDAAGRLAIAFTNGHIAFRQSLLVRTADAERLSEYENLGRADTVGVLPGTTGEARLLQIVGYADAVGILIAGTTVALDSGETAVADGSAAYIIAAGGASAQLAGRIALSHGRADLPGVVHLPDETALFAALEAGEIDAVARGEIGNRDAAHGHAGLAVGALDDAVEWGGFAVDNARPELLDCLNERIDYLTDDRRIGYAAWRDDEDVFMNRAIGAKSTLTGWRLGWLAAGEQAGLD